MEIEWLESWSKRKMVYLLNHWLNLREKNHRCIEEQEETLIGKQEEPVEEGEDDDGKYRW